MTSITTAKPLLTLEAIHLRYGKRDVLTDINLAISPGEIVTLVGPNGAGKSSLAKIALGLVKPSGGSLHKQKRLRTGYVPQKLRIDDSLPLTVDRFLWMAAATTRNQRRHTLARVGAERLFEAAVQSLSGGEMQRVLLARALLRKPQLLVLDEPAQGVDVTGQSALYGLLARLRDTTGCAILLISHDLHLVMAATDRVICLHGHVCCEGTPDSIQQHPEFMRLFGEAPGSLRHVAPYSHHHDHQHNLHGEPGDAPLA